MSFHTLFIRSLVEVHRSSAKSHCLFFPVFIYMILLDLGLEDFPASKPVHIIALIGATFLRQRAAQLKASSKHPRVESFIGDASRPLTSSDPTAEEYVDPIAAVGFTFFIEQLVLAEHAGYSYDCSGSTWTNSIGCAH